MTDKTLDLLGRVGMAVIVIGFAVFLAVYLFGDPWLRPDEPVLTPPAPPCRGDSPGFCPTPLPFLITPPWVTL